MSLPKGAPRLQATQLTLRDLQDVAEGAPEVKITLGPVKSLHAATAADGG